LAQQALCLLGDGTPDEQFRDLLAAGGAAVSPQHVLVDSLGVDSRQE
jgi:hypothetical protein